VALDVLLLGGAGWLIWDDIAARRRVAETLKEANENLETRVRERTAELLGQPGAGAPDPLQRPHHQFHR
jgi:hypothetical protein